MDLPSAPSSPATPSTPAGAEVPKPTTATPSAPPKPTATKPAVRGPDGKFQNSSGVAPSEVETSAQAEQRQEAERRKYRRKVNGAEEELELSDEDVSRELGKARAYELSAKEIKKEKDFWNEVRKAKDNPAQLKKLLGDLGVDVRGFATKTIAEDAEEELLTTEERLHRENEQLKRQFQERDEQEKRSKAETEQRALDERVWAENQPKILEALDKVDLPRSARTLAMFAEIGEEAFEAGVDLSHEQIAAEAQKRFADLHQHVVRKMNVQQLKKVLGPEQVKALLKDSVAELRARQGFTQKPAATEAPAPKQESAEPKGYVSELDARKKLGL